jgi:hypothetical protein
MGRVSWTTQCYDGWCVGGSSFDGNASLSSTFAFSVIVAERSGVSLSANCELRCARAPGAAVDLALLRVDSPDMHVDTQSIIPLLTLIPGTPIETRGLVPFSTLNSRHCC